MLLQSVHTRVLGREEDRPFARSLDRCYGPCCTGSLCNHRGVHLSLLVFTCLATAVMLQYYINSRTRLWIFSTEVLAYLAKSGGLGGCARSERRMSHLNETRHTILTYRCYTNTDQHQVSTPTRRNGKCSNNYRPVAIQYVLTRLNYACRAAPRFTQSTQGVEVWARSPLKRQEGLKA